MIRHLEVTRTIAASPEVVYEAIADVTRMGEWSPECYRCAWIEGSTHAEVGARFEGHNRTNGCEWTTISTVSAADPGERFAFNVSAFDFVFASWTFVIEPTADGCSVTEVWDDYRPDEMVAKPAKSGVTDRADFNRVSMETTLERLAAAVE